MLERNEIFGAAVALSGASRVRKIWEAAELHEKTMETIVEMTCLRGICWTVCFVPRSKHNVSAIDMLHLCREIIAVCSQVHTKHINIMYREERSVLECYAGGTYTYSI